MRCVLFAVVALFAGCATQYGDFPALMPEAAGLVRGVSTGADIVQRLGAPTGTGSALLPPAHEPRSVLFYQDILTTDIKAGQGQVMHMRFRQRILLVFLLNGRYDGFMWYTNEGASASKGG